MNVIVRGYAGDKLLFEEREETNPDYLFHKYGELLMAHPTHMIEFEFMDAGIFFRFGTDPRGMVLPVLFRNDRSTPKPN